MLYRYSPDCKAHHPRAHLATFQGIPQADGHSAFTGLYASGQINEASCWAHPRRGFFEAYERTKPPLALEALQRIGALYRIEELARGRTPTERQRLRNDKSASLLNDLRVWL